MKKRRKIFQRAAALLCGILMIPFLAFPASAASDTNILFDVMDAGLMGSLYTLGPDANSINIDFGEIRVVRYVDFVFTRSGTAPEGIKFVSNFDGTSQYLSVVSLGNMMYRAYGAVSVHSHSNFSLVFDTSGTTYIYPFSCKVSFNFSAGFAETGKLWLADSPTNSGIVAMSDANTPVTLYMPWAIDFSTIQWSYNSVVYLDSWRKYDYMDVFLTVNDADITSLSCRIGDVYVPFEVSFVGDSDLTDFVGKQNSGETFYYPDAIGAYNFAVLRLDLTDVFRSDTDTLYICVSGQFSSGDSYLSLRSVTGYVSADNSELDTFWIKMKNFFSDLFGKNDPAAGAAAQTQEQVDYEVNLQIVQAMEEWDNNIEYVETGFNSGITLVSPGVMWISSLASRIFTNMGDFGSIYLVIGLMSVTMLLLSKSGIAAKISNFAGRGSIGGGKDA